MSTVAQADVPLSRVEKRKAKTNRRLLEVARQLFSEKGIYWAKVEDITETADFGKGTFYKYFDSKAEYALGGPRQRTIVRCRLYAVCREGRTV